MSKNQHPSGLSEKELVELREQVRREYYLSYNTIVRKRQIFRQQDELLNWIKDQDKIDTKTLFYTLYSKMAIVYSDETQVKFVPRIFPWTSQANNLNKLAKFDHDEMQLPILNYEVQLNRFMRWVWIRLQTGWDKTKKIPTWKTIDTRSWVPDPRWWFDPRDFRFHWFEFSDYKYNLSKEDWFYEKEVEKCRISESPETILTRVRSQQAAWLFPATDQILDPQATNWEIAVYYHLTRFKGKPIFTVWWDNIWNLIKFEEIKPVFEEEKWDNRNIPFPVVLNYFCPRKWDPYWTSLADLVQVPHRYKNIMANLMFLREKDLALWDDILYDTNLIKNRNDLSTPTLSKKFIGADFTMMTQNPFYTVPKNPTQPSTYNFSDFLDRISQIATGIDARQMWVQWGSNITLWEAQQLQANNNIKSLFEIRINNQWEKQFWNLWYRAYKENFWEAEKKVVRVTNSMWIQNIEFTKEDLISQKDPDVMVKSKSEITSEKNQQIANLAPLLMQTSADPTAPQIARTYAKRKLYELNNIDEDEAFIYVPPSWEEIDAIDKLPLLNNNDADWVAIDPSEMNLDQMTYITVFKQALPTPATKAAIEARKMAMIQSWRAAINSMPAPISDQKWTWNQAQNMMMQNANNLNQSQSNTNTRANVAQ